MTVRFYFDEHMSRPVEKGLLVRGYEVVMAIDAGMTQKDDDTEHLPYATQNGLVVVTFDHPFAGRTSARTDHAGLICLAERVRYDIGGQIRLLAEFSDTHTPESTAGQIFWLG